MALNGKGRQTESGAERYEEEDMEKQNKESMQSGRHVSAMLRSCHRFPGRHHGDAGQRKGTLRGERLETVVEHKNKGGEVNVVKNPAIAVIMECDTLALAYWKELGLTSKAYKVIKDGKSLITEEPKKLDSIRSKFKVAK